MLLFNRNQVSENKKIVVRKQQAEVKEEGGYEMKIWENKTSIHLS